MRLQDRVAVITGGASGIGRAIVQRFVAEGALVAVWDVAGTASEALEVETLQTSRQTRCQLVDVSDSDSVERGLQDTLAAWGRIDILVNNAGVLRDAQLVKYQDGEISSRMSIDDFDVVIGTNLRGVFLCTRAVAPVMIHQGYGRIVSTSSVVGLYGNFGQTNYVAAKAGVIGMTRVWARELGRYNITVNAVAPGWISTRMTKGMPPRILEDLISRTPLRRLGKAEEVASAFLFLSSDEASFITGATLSVDGGIVV